MLRKMQAFFAIYGGKINILCVESIFVHNVQNNSGQLPAGRVTDKAVRGFWRLKIPIAHKAFDFSYSGGKMGIYTDLAAEMRELNPDIEGIREE